ncbi:MAG TPA: polyprenol monophosphomannose synthase [Chloroflexota bacterium]
MSALVVVPTYNERDNLEPLVGAILEQGADFSLLVVDDNSPDGTGELAENLRPGWPGRIDVLHRPGKLGLGTAYIAGFKWALARGYDYVLEMDADFSHEPSVLPRLLAAGRDSDLALGSRYVPGGGTPDWSLSRRIISRGGSLYARTILGLPVRDLTGGFKCFPRRTLEALDLDAVRSEGYAFQIELTYRVFQLGGRIREIPITFPDRRVGQSKMSGRIVREAMLAVWRMRFTPPPTRAGAQLGPATLT